MRTLRSFWSFPLDGGSVGIHPMRGAQLPPDSWIVSVSLLEVDLVICGPTTTITIGTLANPTGIISASSCANSSGTAPDVWFDTASVFPPLQLHFGAAERLVLTIGGDPVTGGELWLYLNTVSLGA